MRKTEEGDADTSLGSLIQALETVRKERQREWKRTKLNCSPTVMMKKSKENEVNSKDTDKSRS